MWVTHITLPTQCLTNCAQQGTGPCTFWSVWKAQAQMSEFYEYFLFGNKVPRTHATQRREEDVFSSITSQTLKICLLPALRRCTCRLNSCLTWLSACLTRREPRRYWHLHHHHHHPPPLPPHRGAAAAKAVSASCSSSSNNSSSNGTCLFFPGRAFLVFLIVLGVKTR